MIEFGSESKNRAIDGWTRVGIPSRSLNGTETSRTIIWEEEVGFFPFYTALGISEKFEENCVELSNGGGFYLGHYASGWNDELCSTMLNPLCEKDCINCSRPNGNLALHYD